MVYITGDAHGDFCRISEFCTRERTTREDILIVLGDAGIHAKGSLDDTMPITLFCIHANHEQRPLAIPVCGQRKWHGGIVYVEKKYPNVLFARDGEVFEINGIKILVIGNAYSIDKAMRLAYGYGWWTEDCPSEDVRRQVERQLDRCHWKVDVVLSHMPPFKYDYPGLSESGRKLSKANQSLQQWLDEIERRLDYGKWYCGHYHIMKKVGKLEMMCENIDKMWERA